MVVNFNQRSDGKFSVLQMAELKEKLQKRDDKIDRLYDEIERLNRGDNDGGTDGGTDEDGNKSMANGHDHSDTITIED